MPSLYTGTGLFGSPSGDGGSRGYCSFRLPCQLEPGTHGKFIRNTYMGTPVIVVCMKLLQSDLALDMAWSPRRDPVTALAQLSAAQLVADTAQGI